VWPWGKEVRGGPEFRRRPAWDHFFFLFFLSFFDFFDFFAMVGLPSAPSVARPLRAQRIPHRAGRRMWAAAVR
jgi:hypothetical protein